MNLTAHTATVLDQQRAATLDRENDLLRRHRERAVGAPAQPRPSLVARVRHPIRATRTAITH
ncbi:hypothetical protein JOD63_002135 [Microbacterium terrae]|uniref:Transposase n=1 Tax=Microbacterium terrae TaxID=69369 RepID=A0A0M2HL91_9MICO|nr:hypothetical protein [Microbacterium terrae]KJL45129.1 hypothetical protein RS81_00311 [Microbacterium terrae]MBP1078167.1 hypothetical protein [Microbacterium terrae]GLJ97647.1 hypothetical protein GCM10017594_08440 [Microbacterium terrae]